MKNTDIEILRTGTHTAMNGLEVSFSEAVLTGIASAYDPKLHEAPLVVGHPAQDAPAYGWVERLNVAGGILSATVGKLDPEFAESVKAGRYRRVSAALYAPGTKTNPKPDGWYLRHVGLLGAQAPAVKGLKPVELAEDGAVVFEITAFAESGDPHASNRALQAELDTLRQKERERLRADHGAFVEARINEGRVLPAQGDALVHFMEALADDAQTFEFSEHGTLLKATKLDFFMDFLKKQPMQVHYGEFARNTDLHAGGSAEALAQEIADFAEEARAKGHSVTQVQAANAVLSRRAANS